MFSILDAPHMTTLDATREAIRFGGINIEDVVIYLSSGSQYDRLAQVEYYKKKARRVQARKVLNIIILAAIASFLVWL